MTIPAELLHRLAAAKSVTVLTGAGVSAESGVPTFRDALTGLWAKFRPEELATPRAFRRDPRLVWEWYEWRRKLVAGAKPNPAHLALAEMERLFPQFHLITQNVDGLHQRAGSRNVIELHGNIMRTKCSDEGTVVSSWKDTGDVPPKCPACGGLLRPDVVWFEEPMPEAEMEQAATASAHCDVFLSIGTSTVVYPAAALPTEALRGGATVVEINPQPTPLTAQAHFVLAGAAGVVLPELVKALNKPQETKSTIRFSAKLIRPDAKEKVGSCSLLILPKNASAKLPSRGVVMVEGTLNGFPFRAALEPDGKESHLLRVDKPMRAAAGADPGDTVTLEITRVGEEPETRVPMELRHALAAAPSARALWVEITPLARRDWILWIISAKQPETRRSRIGKACDMLASGKRRVCCFGGLNWLRKDHATAGGTWLPLPDSKDRSSPGPTK